LTNPILFTECDLEYHDLLLPYKQEMIERFFVNMVNEVGYNVPYTNEVIDEFIIPEIKKICYNSFDLKDVQLVHPHIYVQNNRYYLSVYHNHVKSDGTAAFGLDPCMVVNFYINPASDGGLLEVAPGVDADGKLKSFKIEVEKDKLYFFPSWLYHRPLPQEDTEYRICVSIDIFSRQRPYFKPGKVYW